MPKVAIAGGASPGLGRAMVIAILNAYPDQKWKPIILSRGNKAPLWLQAIDPEGSRVQIRGVDYTNADQLASNLTDVHTLISVTLAKDGSQLSVQKSLLHAAIKAGCKRYAPAYWGSGVKACRNVTLLRMASDGLWEECENHSHLIECAIFVPGMFMNYLGIGARRDTSSLDEQEKLQLLREGNGYMAGDDEICQGVDKEGDMAGGLGDFMVSIANGTAEIPMRDDGQFPRVSFTLLRDIGEYVAAALDLPKWEKDMSMSTNTMRLDELVNLAESISGKPITITKLSRAELESQVEKLEWPKDMMKQLWLELKISNGKDEIGEGIAEPILNEMCPQVRPVGVAEYLRHCWS